MAAAPLVILAAGTAISAYGQIKQGETQAEAANQSASLRSQEAQETLSRLEINRKAIYNQGELQKGAQLTAYAKSGVDVGTGSVLSTLEQTNEDVSRAIFNAQTEAQFRANSLTTEGGLMRDRGSEERTAGYYGAAGSVLTSAYSYASPRLYNKGAV